MVYRQQSRATHTNPTRPRAVPRVQSVLVTVHPRGGLIAQRSPFLGQASMPSHCTMQHVSFAECSDVILPARSRVDMAQSLVWRGGTWVVTAARPARSRAVALGSCVVGLGTLRLLAVAGDGRAECRGWLTCLL